MHQRRACLSVGFGSGAVAGIYKFLVGKAVVGHKRFCYFNLLLFLQKSARVRACGYSAAFFGSARILACAARAVGRVLFGGFVVREKVAPARLFRGDFGAGGAVVRLFCRKFGRCRLFVRVFADGGVFVLPREVAGLYKIAAYGV